jgi:predicted permease
VSAIVDVILPIFAIIAAGYGCGLARLLGEASSEALNGFVYYVALPALFFLSTANAPLGEVFNGPLIAAFLGGLVLSGLIAALLGGWIFRLDPRERVMHFMASIFSNTGYMGIPLLTAAFGEAGVLPAVIGTMCTGAVVMPLCMGALAAAAPPRASALTATGRAFALTARNPLVTSTVLGVGWSLLVGPETLPTPATRFLDMLAVTAGPCALFAMGLFMVGRSVRSGWQESLWLSAIKLALQPVITFALARYVLDLDPFLTACVVILAGLPTGTLVFVVAQRNGLYTQRAITVIVATTAGAVATLSLILALFLPQ